MEHGSGEVIKVGALELRYVVDTKQSGGSLDMFEFTVPPNAGMPIPHYHSESDELVYMLAGTLTLTVDGQKRELRTGDSHFIARGSVHNFMNLHAEPARALSVQTPGTIGPEFYKEAGAVMGAGGPPDPRKIGEVMGRFGIVPVPPKPATPAPAE
jgi:quercetin dioxygenase-like cupin family protein